MPRQGSLVVVGAVNIDRCYQVENHPAVGRTVLARHVLGESLGGKGANVAVVAAALGARTRLVAAVGADRGGDWAIATLGERGVDATSVQRVVGEPTGTALVFLGRDGDNSIVVSPGANALLDLDTGSPAGWAAGDVVVAQLELPVATVVGALSAADRSGARTILNASPMPEGGDGVREAIESADLVVVNEQEAVALAGWLGLSCSPEPDEGSLRALSAALNRLGGTDLVVTRGAAGLIWLGRSGRSLAVEAAPARVVDTTGAGDATLAALAVAELGGVELDQMLRLARKIGAIACEWPGAQGGIEAIRQSAGLRAVRSARDEPPRHLPDLVDGARLLGLERDR